MESKGHWPEGFFIMIINVKSLLSSSFCVFVFFSPEKRWFTDEPENTSLRTVAQASPCKSSSSSIPPIREVEDECWAEAPWRDPCHQERCCLPCSAFAHEDDNHPMLLMLISLCTIKLAATRLWFLLGYILETDCKTSTIATDVEYCIQIKFSRCKSCLVSSSWTTAIAALVSQCSRLIVQAAWTVVFHPVPPPGHLQPSLSRSDMLKLASVDVWTARGCKPYLPSTYARLTLAFFFFQPVAQNIFSRTLFCQITPFLNANSQIW